MLLLPGDKVALQDLYSHIFESKDRHSQLCLGWERHFAKEEICLCWTNLAFMTWKDLATMYALEFTCKHFVEIVYVHQKNQSSFCCPYLVIILVEWTILSFLLCEQFEEYLVDSFKDLEESTPESKGTSSISVLDMKWLRMGLEKWFGGYKNTPLLTRTQVEVLAPTLGDSQPPMNNSSPWESYTLSSFLDASMHKTHTDTHACT